MEKLVLASFIHDAEYNSTVLPHILPEYFEDVSNQIIVECAIEYCNQHKILPPKIVLETLIDTKLNIPQSIYEKAHENLIELYSDDAKNDVKQASIEWKLDESLKWFVQRRSFLVIEKSIQIMDGTYKENGLVIEKSAIPDMMQKAISINFDTTIGHDYFNEAEERYDFMHTKLNKIPFKIPILNKITGGGLEKKGLTLLLCPPHGGKSLCLGSFSVDWLSLGYNVLVITLEMGEFKIGERIDANMLNVDIDQLKNIPKKTFLSNLDKLQKEKGYGKFLIKEFATSSAGAGHFRFLLNELKNKQNFVPDVVVIDYLGICISTRFKKSDNMYQIQKSIGEEIRSIAVEHDVAVVSAIQTNRGAMGASDFDMSDISESAGHAMTADVMLGLVSTPELVALGQVRVKQLKNRYGSIHEFESFILNMDRKKMKVFQDDLWSRNNPQIIPHKITNQSTEQKNKFENLKGLK